MKHLLFLLLAGSFAFAHAQNQASAKTAEVVGDSLYNFYEPGAWYAGIDVGINGSSTDRNMSYATRYSSLYLNPDLQYFFRKNTAALLSLGLYRYKSVLTQSSNESINNSINVNVGIRQYYPCKVLPGASVFNQVIVGPSFGNRFQRESGASDPDSQTNTFSFSAYYNFGIAYAPAPKWQFTALLASASIYLTNEKNKNNTSAPVVHSFNYNASIFTQSVYFGLNYLISQ